MGQPVYESWTGRTRRISKTLHDELKRCGLNDSDMDEIEHLPQGVTSRTYFDHGQPTRSVVISKEEITTGIYEVKCIRPMHQVETPTQ